MDYGTIHSSFWQKFRRYTSEQRDVAAYLLTNKHRNGIGCYFLPFEQVQIDLNLSLDNVSLIITQSLPNSFVMFCERTEYVYLPNFAERNSGVLFKNPNVIKRRISEYNDIPKEFIYINELRSNLSRFTNDLPIIKESLSNHSPIITKQGSSSVEVVVEVEEVKDSAKAGADAPDPKKLLWDSGIALLGNKSSSRSHLGKLIKEFGEPQVIEAIAITAAKSPANPAAYLKAILKPKGANQFLPTGEDVGQFEETAL